MAEGKELMEWAPFQIIEKVEDEAILAEIRGEVLKDYVYSFKDSSGRTIEGLSKAGVDAVVAELAHRGEAIRELDLNWTEDEKAYKVTVRAGRYAISKDGKEVLLDSAFGAKRQPKTFITKENEEVENPFAFELGIIKAARNAKRRLIPESLAVEIIERAKTEGRARVVPPAYGKPAPAKATTKASPAEEAALAEKKMRQQVAIEAGKVFKTEGERKVWQKKEYGIDSMTELGEEQLKDMLAKLKAMKPVGATPEELGFSSKAEQDQLRKELFNELLPALGYQSDNEKKQYLKDKGAKLTTKMTKEELQNFIEEVKREIKLAEEAENIPSEV